MTLKALRHLTVLGLVLAACAGSSAVDTASALQSDEFNSPTLDTSRWQFKDPLGDSQLTLTGTHATIAIPEGRSHDLWSGANHAPRLLQNLANSDFDVALEFDSPVLARYQMQGLVVEQDADTFMRFELHHNGVGPQLFVSTTAGGTSTVRHRASVTAATRYLRVQRSGSTWTVRISTDGALWTTAVTFQHALTAARLGPFAGNFGSPAPAFTSQVDYFRVLSSDEPPADVTPPVLSGVGATAGASSATVGWTSNEPSDSRVEYGQTTGYGSVRSSTTLVSNHSVDLTGLQCATTYHYRVSSADAAGNRATGGDATFTTGACSPDPGAGGSDEFDGSALDTSAWRVLDPVGDSTVSVGSGHLRVSVPAGVSHDLWSGGLRAPRVLRASGAGDFAIEAKYDAAATLTTQGQGLVAQADGDDLVRFDVYSTGGSTKVFAATFVNGQPTTRVNKTITGGAPLFLRMRRTGSTWTLRYSANGSTWTTAVSFDFPLAVTEFGVFALNAGSPPPAFTSQVDYFRVLSSEEPPADVTPPVLSGVGASAGASSATVGWTSNEPSDSRVEYGLTTAYGDVRSSTTLVSNHSVSLTGLQCQTTYHYRVSSADAAGNRATGGDATFTTGACGTPGGPDIQIWHGDSLRFGELGFPQRWLNVLGHADDPDGLSAVRYRVDNGALKSLVFSPQQNNRINKLGDFNIQLDRLALTAGLHQVTIVATDARGNESSRVVQVQVDPVKTWPLPYTTDWTRGLTRNAQVVDGRWAVQGDGARTMEPGYDRILTLGSETWAGLDVTVGVTIHSLDVAARHSGVGVATGWRGHEGASDDEPWLGWPLGGFCFYYRSGPSRHELYLFDYGWPPFTTVERKKDWIAFNKPYFFRIKTAPVDGQNSRYSCKVWPADSAEPANWQISEVMARRDGSVLLVADYAEVTFGRIAVNGGQ